MNRLALGTHVTFTHRAAVARRKMDWLGNERRWGQWTLTEPRENGPHTSYRGDTLIVMTHVTPITFVDAEELPERPGNARYPVSEERWEKRNKSVFIWPEQGSGVVVGLVRKQYGISHGGSSGGIDGDYDPGYFENFGQLTLYVVKSDLTGPESYIPDHAIYPWHHD